MQDLFHKNRSACAQMVHDEKPFVIPKTSVATKLEQFRPTSVVQRILNKILAKRM